MKQGAFEKANASFKMKSSESRQNNTVIRPARPSDVNNVVQIHIATFPRFFLSNLGPGFLRAYYFFLLRYDNHMFFVVEREGKVVGFVAGFVDPARFFRSMAFKSLHFFVPLVLSFIKHPILIYRIWQNILKVVFIKQHPDFRSEFACELSPLAVDPQYMGQGLGKALVQEFVAVARLKKLHQVRATTDAQDNDYVNVFYQKLGFKLYRTFLAFDARPMNEYVLYLTKE